WPRKRQSNPNSASGKDGRNGKARTSGHSHRSHDKDRGRSGESHSRAARVKNRASTDKADAWDYLRRNTSVISSQIPSKLPGENGEKRGAETDEHVRPQARGLMF